MGRVRYTLKQELDSTTCLLEHWAEWYQPPWARVCVRLGQGGLGGWQPPSVAMVRHDS